ncbi:histidine phosphatase family protein [Niveispirillum cyanobacteriorum]|uniref:Histidine phosphatase family protein n=1 Tax=Niveispirillum cyanobacteriorum TaxID=1612173 RepID=A0A2K9N9H7_9PROT|nr:histidine phosphatase family protein [Niveispirillum cyanobacteriorum]AUN29800.1 histidine phosphatase family protein [Niveispirillum cyanobacteriorum]GGE60610.1 phosphoglycerate mutase [Niveispirillum cyanobacteriorum]
MSVDGAVTRWWWVRHAPLSLPPGTIAGQMDADVDLSDTGMIEGARSWLPDNAIWLTTPLSRSVQSAAALTPDQPTLGVPDLTEQDFGSWHGRTHAEIWDSERATAEHFWQDPAGNAPPGGESFADLCARVSAAIMRETAAHQGRDIVMVGHAGPIRAAMALALGLSPAGVLSVAVDHWHLFRMDHLALGHGDGQWRLIGANIPPCRGRLL